MIYDIEIPQAINFGNLFGEDLEREIITELSALVPNGLASGSKLKTWDYL